MADNGMEGWVMDNKTQLVAKGSNTACNLDGAAAVRTLKSWIGGDGNGLVVSDRTADRRVSVNDLYNNFGRNELEAGIVQYAIASPFRILYIDGSADVFTLKHDGDKNRTVITQVIKENLLKGYDIGNLPHASGANIVKPCRIITKDMEQTGIEFKYILDALVLSFLGHTYRVNFEKTLTEEEFKKEVKNVVDLINQMLESKEKLKAVEENELKKLSITLSGMKYK